MTPQRAIKGLAALALGLGMLVGCDSDMNDRVSDTGARNTTADRSGSPALGDRRTAENPAAPGAPTTAPGATNPATPGARDNARAAAADDDAIKDQVKAKLQDQAAAGLDRVNVESKDGVVRLTGKVQQPDMKERAAELARNVEGVRQVVNEIEVAA